MQRSWMKTTVKITISKTIGRGLNVFDPRPIILKTIGRGSNWFKPRPIAYILSCIHDRSFLNYRGWKASRFLTPLVAQSQVE